MAVESNTDVENLPLVVDIADEPPRTVVPPAFYNDDEPPEPPEDDPHWREFPLFESMKASHLLVAGIMFFVLFATFAHLMLLLAIQPGT